MNRIIFVTVVALFTSACTKDSIERRHDYTISSHEIGGIRVEVTLKESQREYGHESDLMTSDWVGPYHLSIKTIQEKKNRGKITVSSAEISYREVATIKNISTPKLRAWKYGDKDKLSFI